MTPSRGAASAALALALAFGWGGCGYYGPPRWPEEKSEAPSDLVIPDTDPGTSEGEPRSEPQERDGD